MAFNKKQTSLMTRIGIVIVAIILVISFIPGLFGLFSSTGSTPQTDTGLLESIAGQYAPRIQANQQILASDPTSYTVLVAQADDYYYWGEAIQQQEQARTTGADLPLWVASAAFYERAVAVRPGDPGVTTNYAITVYYSGDAPRAISIIEPVMMANPDFGQAFFNAGIFYRAVGRNADAITVLQRSIEIDPQATYVANANSFLSELQAAGGGATTTPSTPETKTP